MSDAWAEDVTLAALSEVFRPSAPTDDRQLFRGRREQMRALTQVMQAQGQHAIVFGERGVGKTSLAYMAMGTFTAHTPDALAIRIACGATDTYTTVWRKLVPRLEQELDLREQEVREQIQPVIDRIDDIFMDDPTPSSVARALHLLAAAVPLLIVLDEFDRINGYSYSADFADLVKQLSDDLIPCTICFVGVADDVAGLIAGHASIDRALRAVHMPRMDHDELSEIVSAGFIAFSERSGYELEINESAIAAIAHLSQGFPYFTHLLSKSVGEEAIYGHAHEIDFSAVFTALVRAKNEAEPSIKDAFYRATIASRADATYEQTLVACALARPDYGGYFTASDVRPYLEDILHTPRRNSDFNAHLKRFSQDDPIILDRADRSRTKRYRFSNPLMKPFVVMVGFEAKMIDARSLGLDPE